MAVLATGRAKLVVLELASSLPMATTEVSIKEALRQSRATAAPDAASSDILKWARRLITELSPKATDTGAATPPDTLHA